MYPDLYTINFESDKPPNYDQAATSNANGDRTLQNDESTPTSEKICTRCCPTLVILALVGIIAATFIGKIKRSRVASFKFEVLRYDNIIIDTIPLQALQLIGENRQIQSPCLKMSFLIYTPS